MSATEDATAAAAAPVEATNGGAEDQPRKPRRENKDNETPIEELFDLTQPIPRVEKPDKDKHDAQLAALNDAMEAIKLERAALQEKIDTAMNAGSNEKGGLNDLRSQMNTLKSAKQKLIDEKKIMRLQLDQHKAAGDKLLKDKKDVRSNLKYGSIAEIDAEIKNLQRRQETTSMSLQEEKKLIKEMDALAASKKLVAVVQAKDVAMDDVQALRKSLQSSIQEKDKEIDAVTKDLDAVVKSIKELNEKDTSKRDALQALFTERDAFKGRVQALIAEKETIRTAFRTENDAWYTYQRAIRAQKKMQYEAEKKRREEEYAAKQAAIEAEIAKTIPYEEEQALCDFLADYLERTYLGKKSAVETATETILDGVKAADTVIPVPDDPFAGVAAVNKKDEDEIFFGKGKQKKKRVRASKDEKKPSDVPFTLSVDIFEQFGMIQLTPPVTLEQVPNSVTELQAKKVWYSEQPRGSVPTAAEYRRQQQQQDKANASSSSTAPTKATSKKPPKPFSLEMDEFVPLSAAVATETTTNGGANWGKTAAPAATDNGAAATEEAQE